jgi:hypothetical protein
VCLDSIVSVSVLILAVTGQICQVIVNSCVKRKDR